MTASFQSDAVSDASDLTVRQQRTVDALRQFFGTEAEALYDASGRSLHKLTYFARQSTLPACHRLVIGLALAQELLVEELMSRPMFDTPVAVSDFLTLHFAGQLERRSAFVTIQNAHEPLLAPSVGPVVDGLGAHLQHPADVHDADAAVQGQQTQRAAAKVAETVTPGKLFQRQAFLGRQRRAQHATCEWGFDLGQIGSENENHEYARNPT